VTANRVRALIEAKRLKAMKVGHAWLIDPKDLEAVKKRTPGRPRKSPPSQPSQRKRPKKVSKT
jgi:hypothetical protein